MGGLSWSKDRARRLAQGASESRDGSFNGRALADAFGAPKPRSGPSKAELRAIGEGAAAEFQAALIAVTCPGCGRAARIHSRYVGKRLRCQQCKRKFTLRA